MPEDIIAPQQPPENTEETSASPLPTQDTPPRASLLQWLVGGLRASFLLEPRVDAQPTPWQLLLLALLPELVWTGLARLEIAGPAQLYETVGLNTLWVLGVLAWLGWFALSGRARGGGLARWFVLATWAMFPANLALGMLALGYTRGWLPSAIATSPGYWVVFGLGCAWMVLALVRLTAREAGARWRLAICAPAFVALLTLTFWQSLNTQDRMWQPDATSASTEPERPRMQLTQELFEAQQALWEQTVEALPAGKPGQTNVFGLVFAPYAAEDVFLRESNMVTQVLEERFDAKGRVIHLLNNPATAETLPWATPLNLRRAIAALAARMDRENDVLVVYLTSHGARDHRLAAAHWPLTVPWLTPEELREELDGAGIRHRVVAVSACYSGGWIEPLASEDTLVMTAADATHTSYGCGRLSELTFFGRAMFDEALRKTRSFETAFAAAVPVIRQREIDGGKDDGFSNPQISMGEKIRPVLERLAQRLDAAGK
ncbi:C13 family peptidase [Variovorax sp. CAN2819]|uniref:C13 family peptidase n=1 Tax=Variovorax sp. CAN15 TaxID=3046727 RepID=UPI002648A43F|nr:C13 family peptidase [Variovorax sp. CAN15]MDN6884000.1 C13 family peptidase [Variovorax sp. CAN15]